MYLRHTTVRKNGKTHTYWRLVQSVRIGREVKQVTVCQLGELDEEGRLAARQLANTLVGVERQPGLFDDPVPSEPITLDLARLQLERGRRFGDAWLALKLWQALMIRNVMLVAPLGMDRELEYLSERLSGEFLTPAGHAEASIRDSKPLISGPIELRKFTPPSGKFIAGCYLATANTWHTVTPAILPGHDDHKSEKTRKLIQRALRQIGIDTPCEFTWQSIPFFKNTLSAHKYDRQGRHTGYYRPARLMDLTAVHLRIRFGHRRAVGDLDSQWIPHSLPGPLVIGAGRHCGFGILAGVS